MVSRLLSYLPTAVISALLAYFGFQALSGDRGLLHAHQRHQHLAQTQAKLAQLHARRMSLETHARLLRTDSLSADLLEERAHVLLGFTNPSDYVIRTTPNAG